MLFLISDSLSSYEALPTDGRNWYIHGNGLEITVRKDKYSKFVVTGYSNDLFSDKTNTEAAETINAVIAKYGYTQEFLDLYTLVGAELASIYPNIALQIKSVNLYYKKHNKYIPDISINQLNEPIITKNNILISKNISSFQNNNTDILEIDDTPKMEHSYTLCGLKIGPVDYTVKAVITNTIDGKRYYDHKLTNIEKVK